MTPPPIPLIRAAGSHREAGRQVGEATAGEMARMAEAPFDAELIARYRAATLEHLPWIVEELDGAAEGAGLDPLAVFAASVEELAPAEAPTGCSDLVATGARTAGGHLLVAHTNDLYAEDEPGIVAVEWRVPGEPVVFTLGSGPWISVGWNGAGLSVTGNEVSPNDERVGIPRLLQVRDVLTRRSLDEAVDASLHPARSSAYNWVLAHRDGAAVNVEASATSAGIDKPRGGFLAHTNHYDRADMRAFERPGDYESSCARLDRARELATGGGFTAERLRGLLADHENGENAICRHGEEPKAVKTVFWCVADVTAGEITYGRGNPCDSEAQAYRFEPYP
ncbi:MAG TPA: C45 family peptidase [Gaiellaceae bacterium]|nr:C45 family peptidase [Gaiellaceae bacterium]